MSSSQRAAGSAGPGDTIVAIATPAGRGGIGVVRLSGSLARAIAGSLIRTAGEADLKPRRAVMGDLLDPEGRVVDQVIVTLFESPHSYTLEDVVEISCHGSPVILGCAVERAIAEGARLAEPGEFTQRAWLNGRIDLAQAEGVRDLIEATTLYQARVAVQQVSGALSARLAPPKKQLLDLIALLEAGIDFAEDDLDVASKQEILTRLTPLESALGRLAESYRYGKVIREGITMAILGRPNVGKSSLFNRLLEQDRAIVTPVAGTTRDALAEYCSIGGVPVRLMDTAGICATGDLVESKGVEKSYEALAGAELVVVVIDLSQPVDSTDLELLERARETGRCLLVGNKSDLPRIAQVDDSCLPVSALDGTGIAELRERIREMAIPSSEADSESGWITNIRHQTLLRESLTALGQAREAARNDVPHEMLLLDLYSALRPIDSITGATTTEDILENIFSTFCIGK